MAEINKISAALKAPVPAMVPVQATGTTQEIPDVIVDRVAAFAADVMRLAAEHDLGHTPIFCGIGLIGSMPVGLIRVEYIATVIFQGTIDPLSI